MFRSFLIAMGGAALFVCGLMALAAPPKTNDPVRATYDALPSAVESGESQHFDALAGVSRDLEKLVNTAATKSDIEHLGKRIDALEKLIEKYACHCKMRGAATPAKPAARGNLPLHRKTCVNGSCRIKTLWRIVDSQGNTVRYEYR